MRKFITGLFLMVIASKATAAGPITHVYLADQLIKYNPIYSSQNASGFYIGTLFPDIRYFLNIQRTETHQTGLTLTDVVHASSPFKAGENLHCYVDERREQLVVEWGMYDQLQEVASGGHLASLLKLLEDEILFDKVNPEVVIGYLNTVSPEELKQGITQDKIATWHMMLAFFVSQRPSEIIGYLAESNSPFLNIPAETVKLWHANFALLLEKPAIQMYVQQLSDTFANEFHQFAQQ